MAIRLRERLGMTPPPKLRMDEISDRLRMAVWNTLYTLYINHMGTMGHRAATLTHSLRWDVAAFGHNLGALVDRLKHEFLSEAKSWEFYETLDIVARGFAGLPGLSGDGYWRMWNDVLSDDGAAFRFVNSELVPLTNEAEIAEVEMALRSPLQTVREHIDTALKKLAERPEPDVRNAIKEAISAVEGALKVTTGRTKGDLGDALPDFEVRYGALHGAFRGAIEKLYAFTSDEKGVRHSLLDAGAKVDLDDARFMVVACSALSNFLVARASVKGWPSKT